MIDHYPNSTLFFLLIYPVILILLGIVCVLRIIFKMLAPVISDGSVHGVQHGYRLFTYLHLVANHLNCLQV